MTSVWGELKRRNVVRVAVAYAIAAWLLIEITATTFPILKLPDWSVTLVTVLVLIGFPLALILAWAFELTPEGIKKEKDVDRSESITHITGRKFDFVVIGVLGIAVVYFVADKFVWSPGAEIESQVDASVAVPQEIDKSIAVLPFLNMSADPEQEYFSDGISEELLNLLVQMPGLQVAARTSSFQFKDRNEDVAKIADVLNVAHILEGSVRKSGNRVRITAQLIQAEDGYHLWSETFDREMGDIFAVQDEIAGAISDALKVKLALVAGEAVQPTVIKAASTDAYEAYLRGRQLVHRRGRENLQDAVRHLERSLRLDERFAPAHAQLAIATTLLMASPQSYGTLSLEEVRRIAIPHLERALELKPNLAEAHGGLALLMRKSGDPTSAIEYGRRALELNPSYSDAMNWMYLTLSRLGRYEEADVVLMQMLVIDPMTIIGRSNYANWLGGTGKVEEGHQIADQLLKQSLWWGSVRHAEMSLVYEAKLDEGLAWGLKAHVEEPSVLFSIYFVILGFNWIGEYDEARRISDVLAYMTDIAEGHYDDAIQATQRKTQLDSENEAVILAAANALYSAGRIDEALPFYERLLDISPEGRPVTGADHMGSDSNEMTMRLALARRKAGDGDGAQTAAQIARQDNAARRAVGKKSQYEHRTEAMIAAFEKNPDGAISSLNSAMQHGLRDPQVFGDPIFEDLWDQPRFVALQQELDAILAVEHDKVLQLICFNNPVPENWQPMPETCEGVVEKLEL